MADEKSLESYVDAKAKAPSADELRMQLLEQQMQKAEKESKLREAERKKLSEFTEKFLTEHVGEDELTMIRRLVVNAVKDGKFEAMIYSFPSGLCTDKGRAINNSDPNWPETLQGKARELYDRYQTIAKPQGYKLKAMIINFPGGMPGDVGLFLDWEPERF